jgi:hypothetical protein
VTTAENFQTEFLRNYLMFGIGTLGKRDTDALVMYLLDKYGLSGTGPLHKYSNQDASVLLRAPVSRIKQLRYESGLKYGNERIEDQALARLLVALNGAALDVDADKIHIVIEDALAKNWLQGQLKTQGLLFDHSFNAELLKVDAAGLFKLLEQFFDTKALQRFKEQFAAMQKEKQRNKLRERFVELAKEFAVDAAKEAGVAVARHFAMYLPHIGG